MRTTVFIADDVLAAARERARHEKNSVGQVVSEAWLALTGTPPGSAAGEPAAIDGLRPFSSRGGIVSNAAVDRLREDDAY